MDHLINITAYWDQEGKLRYPDGSPVEPPLPRGRKEILRDCKINNSQRRKEERVFRMAKNAIDMCNIRKWKLIDELKENNLQQEITDTARGDDL